MKTGVFWRQVSRIHKAEFADVELEHVLADNCAMQLVRWPKQYDVIVTDNLFGDILSDVAAMLTGSLGMLPSPRSARRTRRPAGARRSTSPCTARRPTSREGASPTPSP
jgi:isocitrate/isopropylmalate dehydrogenase